MPRPDAVDLIARNLANLPHPDGTDIRLAAFSAINQPDGEVVGQITAWNKAIAESVVNLLETSGYTLRHQNDPKPTDGARSATALCADCGASLIHLARLDEDGTTYVSSTLLVESLQQLKKACPHA